MLPLGGAQQRALLAILLLRANRVVPIERLADELYAGAPPVTAVTQVQRQISELRKALGDAHGIETRAPGYVIRVFPGQLDLSRFERQTEEAGHALAAGHAKKAADLLSDALALWRGRAARRPDLRVVRAGRPRATGGDPIGGARAAH